MNNFKFGDMAQWNGMKCVVLSVNESQTSAWVAFENQDIDQVAVSDLFTAYKGNVIDGWVLQFKSGGFFSIRGSMVWDTAESAVCAFKKAYRLSHEQLKEELKDYDLVHYQLELRDYPKFYYPKETE